MFHLFLLIFVNWCSNKLCWDYDVTPQDSRASWKSRLFVCFCVFYWFFLKISFLFLSWCTDVFWANRPVVLKQIYITETCKGIRVGIVTKSIFVVTHTHTYTHLGYTPQYSAKSQWRDKLNLFIVSDYSVELTLPVTVFVCERRSCLCILMWVWVWCCFRNNEGFNSGTKLCKGEDTVAANSWHQ